MYIVEDYLVSSITIYILSLLNKDKALLLFGKAVDQKQCKKYQSL